jgi:hypothetical protein
MVNQTGPRYAAYDAADRTVLKLWGAQQSTFDCWWRSLAMRVSAEKLINTLES